MATRARVGAVVESVAVHAYTIPTAEPESDGTLEWDSTTIVVVEASAERETGLGYTYCDTAAAALIEGLLRQVVHDRDALDVQASWHEMGARIRNVGRPGIGLCAVSAVDIALWDLKARLLDLPLVVLLGAFYDELPVYGSGGFTSYGLDQLERQLAGWVDEGIERVKLKVGRDPEHDPARLDAARGAIGNSIELFVDANGAYTRKQALEWAERLASEWGVSWLEEPVSSRLRGTAPAARSQSGWARDRGRRVRLRARRLPYPAGLRRLPAGGRDSLRRHHGPASGSKPRSRLRTGHLVAWSTGSFRPRLLGRRTR